MQPFCEKIRDFEMKLGDKIAESENRWLLRFAQNDKMKCESQNLGLLRPCQRQGLAMTKWGRFCILCVIRKISQ
ncbi:hypothetical protein [Helicobacter sp. 23-1045]